MIFKVDQVSVWAVANFLLDDPLSAAAIDVNTEGLIMMTRRIPCHCHGGSNKKADKKLKKNPF